MCAKPTIFSWYLAYPTTPATKRAVLGLIERGGKVRTFHVMQATKVNVAELVNQNVAKESIFYTDESRLYTEIGKAFAAHETTTHSAKES